VTFRQFLTAFLEFSISSTKQIVPMEAGIGREHLHYTAMTALCSLLLHIPSILAMYCKARWGTVGFAVASLLSPLDGQM
jgi:hypothetical protein